MSEIESVTEPALSDYSIILRECPTGIRLQWFMNIAMRRPVEEVPYTWARLLPMPWQARWVALKDLIKTRCVKFTGGKNGEPNMMAVVDVPSLWDCDELRTASFGWATEICLQWSVDVAKPLTKENAGKSDTRPVPEAATLREWVEADIKSHPPDAVGTAEEVWARVQAAHSDANILRKSVRPIVAELTGRGRGDRGKTRHKKIAKQ
jgi:hypothetical protein